MKMRCATSSMNTKALLAALPLMAGAALSFGQATPEPVAPPPADAVAGMPKRAPEGDAPPAAPTTTDQPKRDSSVKVDDNMIVDLHVNDEELGNVLEMLSIHSQKNIIASKNVSARVTANLYNVSFYEALDAILNVNGYGYLENGNFITIYTREELDKMIQAQRQRVSKVIKLNYMSSTDAAEMVKPLLSTARDGGEAGQIKANGKLGAFPAMGDTPIGNEEYAQGSMIVIFDYEENVAAVEELLRQLDVQPQQVLVEATILQTSLNEANALGVDFSILADANFSEFVGVGGPLGVANALISGRDGAGALLPADGGATGIASTVGGTAGKGGLKVGVVSNDVAVFLRVLDEVTDTTILSNPKILALNRQASRVLVGRKVGYLSTTSTDTATTQTVQFLDTGTQLYFRPIVLERGQIRMELKPQVSEAVIREQSDASGAAVTIPDEITNELVTNVIVRDGQTVVLGGLFRESTESTRSQIPFLGDVPLVGYAFRGQSDEVQRNEIIFTVTPHIVTDASATEMGQRAMAYGDRVVAGAREGVLFFSRDHLTSLLNVEAEKKAGSGEDGRAMWYLQRSLGMNAAQPEAIALREKLTNKPTFWPSRSVLQRIIDGETDTVLRKKGGTSNASATDLMFPLLSTPVAPTAQPEATTANSTPSGNQTPANPADALPPVDDPAGTFTNVPEQPSPSPIPE